MNEINTGGKLKVYLTADISEQPLIGKTIAILGYGIQGQAQAANLRDEGYRVIVGGRQGKSLEKAKTDGFEALGYIEAAKKADVLLMLTPDTAHKNVIDLIASTLSGKTLVFAHGSSVHLGWAIPPKDCDVVLIAPSGTGKTVRETYLNKKGMVATFAVHQDVSGSARITVLCLCRVLGFTQAGVFESSFKDEAVADLFGEQVILCGGVPELVRLAYDTMVKRGYSKEMAYFATLYELKSLASLYAEVGLDGMLERVSEAARFGGLMVGPKVVTRDNRKKMEEVLDHIESGTFMNAFQNESQNGFIQTREKMAEEIKKDINQTGEKIRKSFHL